MTIPNNGEQPQDIAPHMLVQPGPLGFSVGAGPGPDGKQVVVIRMETTIGSLVFPMDPAFAKTFGKSIMAAARNAALGLTVIGDAGDGDREDG